jgi:hypothetical protein
MSFIDVGAQIGGANVPTKKALRVALAHDETSVTFTGTSAYTPFHGTGADVTHLVKLATVGPDPHTNRQWYATVTRSVKTGRLTVS